MASTEPLPAPEKARTGRDLQRYSTEGERLLAGCASHHVRHQQAQATMLIFLHAFFELWQVVELLQCCRCIPIRTVSAVDGVEGVKVLLVSSRGASKGLVFPKVMH